jgi:hypothetical protein
MIFGIMIWDSMRLTVKVIRNFDFQCTAKYPIPKLFRTLGPGGLIRLLVCKFVHCSIHPQPQESKEKANLNRDYFSALF